MNEKPQPLDSAKRDFLKLPISTLRQLADEGLDMQDLTCSVCGATSSCPFAWDSYNTNGDCLASK